MRAQGTCTRQCRGDSQRAARGQGYHNGHYNRNLNTASRDVALKVLELKGILFETAITERDRRRESSAEKRLSGVSVQRVEDIKEVLWGSKVSPAAISELNNKVYVHIWDWRNRLLQRGQYPYVSMWMESICVATEAESLKMQPFW